MKSCPALLFRDIQCERPPRPRLYDTAQSRSHAPELAIWLPWMS
jgi:hypothetical protein